MGTVPTSNQIVPRPGIEIATIPFDAPWLEAGAAVTAPATTWHEDMPVSPRTGEVEAAAIALHCARWASLRFFIITVLALVETLLWIGKGSAVLALASAIVTGTFAFLGIRASRMNRTTFLVGASVYTAETLCLFGHWGPGFYLPLFVHAFIVWRYYCMYRVLRDLEAL